VIPQAAVRVSDFEINRLTVERLARVGRSGRGATILALAGSPALSGRLCRCAAHSRLLPLIHDPSRRELAFQLRRLARNVRIALAGILVADPHISARQAGAGVVAGFEQRNRGNTAPW
jgi:hypothetical protein